MHRKFFGYSFLSFISFCFFTALFNTAANAETPMFPYIPTPTQSQSTITIIPVPTHIITSTRTIQPTETPFPTATPTISPTQTPEPTIPVAVDLESFFVKYSDEYHVDKEELKKIAQCESGFNSQSDTGYYAGMFQFSPSSWINARSSMGLDTSPDLRKNAEESIKTAAYMISNGQINAWTNCK